MPLLIAERFDYGPLGVGLVYAVLSLCFVIATPGVGWLADNRVRWRPVRVRVRVSERVSVARAHARVR
jgi:hypothetical protein